MSDWYPKMKEQAVRRRCGACNATVIVQTNGTVERLKFHTVGGHVYLGAPRCSASYSSDPDLMLPLRD